MATRNIVPRATGEGGLGVSGKHWGTAYIDNLYGTAASAAHAGSSGQAGTSAYSTSAGNSGTAYFATSSGESGSSGSATTAANSGTSSFASSSANSGSAGSATTAAEAGTAYFATTSVYASTSSYAGTSGNAGTAYFATSAGQSGSAGSATTSANAGSASFASTAGIAGTSPYSGTASYATTSGVAGSSANAGSAGSATTAAKAGTSSFATSSGFSGTSSSAGYATSAGRSGTSYFSTTAGNSGSSSYASSSGYSGTSYQSTLSASETTAGISRLATSSETVAGTSTSLATDPAGVAAAIAVSANPKAMAQGVAYTAAAAAATQVPHNANYSNTTNNGFIHRKVILPLWTPAANQIIYQKLTGGAGTQLGIVATTGTFQLTLNTKTYVSLVPGGGAASNLVAGSEHDILTTWTVGATTTVSFYLDGYLLSTPAAQANVDLTNTAVLYLFGTSAARYAGTDHGAWVGNFAPTAAEILDAYKNGIPESWKWGSQTEKITNSDDRDFTVWANVHWIGNSGGSVADGTGKLQVTMDGSANCGAILNIASYVSALPLNKRYRITADVWQGTTTKTAFYMGGNGPSSEFQGAEQAITISGVQTTFSTEFTLISGAYISIGTLNADSGTFFIDNVSVKEIGVAGAWESEGFQPAPGQCLDSSSNKNHAMQPASGSSLTRFKKDFEYRWTNTWTASSAAQYIGGLNQSILSTKHFVTSIVSRATVVTDIENIEIGDGSDANYYVTAVAPTAAPIIHTLAKNLNDGTNLKLVVTPAAEATMTVEFIVRGYLLE
jgi:hypothetical protein